MSDKDCLTPHEGMQVDGVRPTIQGRIRDLQQQLAQARQQIEEHVTKIRNQKTEIERLSELHLRASEQIEELKLERDEAFKSWRKWKREFDVYRDAWLREIGGVIRNKAHEIDGFVLRTREIYELSKRAEAAEASLAQAQKERDERFLKAADAWRTRDIDHEHEIAAVQFGPAQLLDEILLNGKNPPDYETTVAQARREGMEEAAAIALSYKGDLLAGPDGKILRLDKFPDEIAAAIRRAAEEK